MDLYLDFVAMRVGRHWVTRFGRGYTLFGVAGIILMGITTASLKNLAPLHKEKECST